jgi:hypothetical protein
MSSRLKRIVRKADGNRLQKRRAVLPPREQLIKEARILRESGDPKAVAVADAFLATDRVIFGDDGWIERRGGGEATRQQPLLPEWKGREPPENT